MGGAVKSIGNVVNGAANLVKKTPAGMLPAVRIATNAYQGAANSLLGTPKLQSQQVDQPYQPTDIEQRSGIMAPKYSGVTDAEGNLQGKYTYDPTKSAAFTKLQQQAMAAPGSSPWAQVQNQQQALEQGQATDQAAKTQAQALAQAQSGLARFGGLQSGTRARLAMQGQKDLLNSQQDVARQGLQSRLGITSQDIDRQQQALGSVGQTELQGQAQNLNSALGDVANKAQFDAERYRQQMAAYGAEKTANGQVAAANSSGGGSGGIFGNIWKSIF